MHDSETVYLNNEIINFKNKLEIQKNKINDLEIIIDQYNNKEYNENYSESKDTDKILEEYDIKLLEKDKDINDYRKRLVLLETNNEKLQIETLRVQKLEKLVKDNQENLSYWKKKSIELQTRLNCMPHIDNKNISNKTYD